MSSVDHLGSNKSTLCVEDICIDSFDRITAYIIVSVACVPIEMIIGYSVFLKGIKNL